MPTIEDILPDGSNVSKPDLREYLSSRVPASVMDDDAVGDGTADDTAALAANEYTQRNVPDGTYATTGVSVDGLYGPGIVQASGSRLPISLSARELNPAKKFMEKLSRVRGKYQRVLLIGDSISDFYYTTANAKHWFSMLRRAVNFFQASTDEELITNFDDPSAGNNPVTLSGVTFGTAGPLGHSAIIAAGGYIEFTGAYQQVDVYFQRAVSAGSLLFKYNGTTYKTISAAGAAANDMHTTEVAGYVSATAASGTHRIQASGAAVEVTGLDRLGGSYPGVGAEQIRFGRIARQGYASTNFATNAALASIKAMVCAEPSRETSRQGLFIVAIGANNIYNVSMDTTAAQYGTDLMKIFALLREAGSIVYLPPYEWGISATSADTWREHLAAAEAACHAFRVPVIRAPAYDFKGDATTLLTSNHLNDAGNKKLFEIIVEQLADAVESFDGPAVASGTRHLGGHFSAVNVGGPSTSASSDQDFGFAIGAIYDIASATWISTHKQATIWRAVAGELRVYHDSGLTVGNALTPTLRQRLNSSGQPVAESNMQVKGSLFLGSAGLPGVSSGTGSPEGVVTAGVGSIYLRENGGAVTSVYFKESGSGNTGWAAK